MQSVGMESVQKLVLRSGITEWRVFFKYSGGIASKEEMLAEINRKVKEIGIKTDDMRLFQEPEQDGSLGTGILYFDRIF